MNLELNEAGMTFLVGAFVILSAEAISYFIFRRHLTKFFKGPLGIATDGTPATLTTGVFVGFSFAVGLLVEDVCYKYSDPYVYRPFRFTYGTLHLAASDHHDSNIKGSMQHGVLISDLRSTNPSLTGLGNEVFSSGIFEYVLGPRGRLHTDWALHGGPLPPSRPDHPYESLQNGITAVFYFAKNRVYTVDNYFNELRRIHSRLEFSSTIATTSLVAALFCLTLGPVRLIAVCRSRRQRTRTAKRLAKMMLAYVMVYLFAYLAYVHESEEFNKRIFGYYDSMLRAAETPMEQRDATAPALP